MNTMQLHINSLEFDDAITDIESIWGKIYIEIDGVYFPDEDWFDVVSSVLDMWMNSIIEFIVEKKEQCTLYFMDGPYEIQLCAYEKNNISIICKEQDGEMYVNEIVDFNMFVNMLLNCVSVFLEECRWNIQNFSKTTMCSTMINSCRKLRKESSAFK